MYQFGTIKRTVTTREAAKLRAIAKAHDCTFTGPVKLPGNPNRGWFSKPNEGAPWDANTQREVLAAARAEGIDI